MKHAVQADKPVLRAFNMLFKVSNFYVKNYTKKLRFAFIHLEANSAHSFLISPVASLNWLMSSSTLAAALAASPQVPS